MAFDEGIGWYWDEQTECPNCSSGDIDNVDVHTWKCANCGYVFGQFGGHFEEVRRGPAESVRRLHVSEETSTSEEIEHFESYLAWKCESYAGGRVYPVTLKTILLDTDLSSVKAEKILGKLEKLGRVKRIVYPDGLVANTIANKRARKT